MYNCKPISDDYVDVTLTTTLVLMERLKSRMILHLTIFEEFTLIQRILHL